VVNLLEPLTLTNHSFYVTLVVSTTKG